MCGVIRFEEDVAVIVCSEAFRCIYAREVLGIPSAGQKFGLQFLEGSVLPRSKLILFFDFSSVLILAKLAKGFRKCD